MKLTHNGYVWTKEKNGKLTFRPEKTSFSVSGPGPVYKDQPKYKAVRHIEGLFKTNANNLLRGLLSELPSIL